MEDTKHRFQKYMHQESQVHRIERKTKKKQTIMSSQAAHQADQLCIQQTKSLVGFNLIPSVGFPKRSESLAADFKCLRGSIHQHTPHGTRAHFARAGHGAVSVWVTGDLSNSFKTRLKSALQYRTQAYEKAAEQSGKEKSAFVVN